MAYLPYTILHNSKLQGILGSAARFVCSIPRYSDITPSLCSLHWLPLVINFKGIDGLAPEYICNLFNKRTNSERLLALSPTTTNEENFTATCFVE